MPFKIVRNDLTKMQTEAIVNTANEEPAVGTGCDYAVYRAAGYQELLSFRKKEIGPAKEGDVFITPGFRLPAKYIIHAVSPLYIDGRHGEEELLRACYRKSLKLAEEYGMRDRIWYSSFNRLTIEKIHLLDRKAKVGFLYAEVFSGMPVLAGNLGLSALHPSFPSLLSPRFMKECRNNGIAVNVWTIDSPEQLRDPAFTREHGFTASVTDDVLFNSMARPGDRERGVVTVVNQPGAYDYLAIEWIYSRPDAASDKALADSLIRSKAGNPAFFFLPYTNDSPDPRCYRGDLGNDPFEEYANAVRRLHYIAANAPEWYERTVPQNTSFRACLLEQILLHHCTEHRKLARLVGGLYVQDISSGSKYVAVGKDDQKKALATAINGLNKTDYMDSNKELQAFSGAYSEFATIMRINAVNKNSLNSRLKWCAAATKLGITDYPIADLLSDITDEVTGNMRKGYLPEGEEFLVGVWMAMGLMRSLPVYEQNYKEYNHKTVQLYAPLPLSERIYGTVLENACIVELDRLEGILKKSLRAAQGEYDKNRIRYLLSQLEGMKGTKTP